MKQKKTIVLVDKNKEFITDLADFLRENGYEVMTALDGRTGHTLVLENKPDILITSLIIPGLDGLSLIYSISNNKILTNKPKMIAMSVDISDNMIQSAFKSGAEFFIAKPFDYENLLNHISDMFCESLPSATTTTTTTRPLDIETHISNYLKEAGVPVSLKGYRCLKTAIQFVVEEPDTLEEVTKFIYPATAKIHGTTPSKVERAIRHAVETSWNRGNPDLLNKLFGYTVSADSGKPTNSEFIATMAEVVRLDMKHQ